MKRPRND